MDNTSIDQLLNFELVIKSIINNLLVNSWFFL
jgi:hypothetical protein